MAEAPKRREQRETRLVSEFVAREFPTERAVFNHRVGPIKPAIPTDDLAPEEVLFLGESRRRADAIIIRETGIVLLEAFILPVLGKVSQILVYKELLPMTPEFELYRELPISCFLVGPIDDPTLASFARRQDVGYRVFRPPWVVDYLNTLAARFRRPRKQLLEG